MRAIFLNAIFLNAIFLNADFLNADFLNADFLNADFLNAEMFSQKDRLVVKTYPLRHSKEELYDNEVKSGQFKGYRKQPKSFQVLLSSRS